MNALLAMIGNNIKPMKDFNTRMLIINMNSRMEDPGKREFSRDSLLEWRENFSEDVIKACLTIIKAPKNKVNGVMPRSRFKDWSKYVQVPIYQVSGLDIGQLFTKNIKAKRAEDEWGHCLESLWNHFGAEQFISADLITLFQSNDDKFKNLRDDISDKLKKTPLEPVTKFDIGRYLRKKEDKIHEGLTIKSETGTSGDFQNSAIC